MTSTPNQDNPLMHVADKQGHPILEMMFGACILFKIPK
ncbi:hypothetical protein [Aquimarina hainanensis]